MIEQYFVQPAVLRRLRSGLMAPYLDSLTTELQALHYSHKSIRRQPRNVDAFGRWLINQKIPLNEVTDAVVNRYVKPMHRSPSPGRARGYRPHNGRGLARLLELLRRRSVVPLESTPAVVAEPREQILVAFDQHLERVAGIAPSTRVELVQSRRPAAPAVVCLPRPVRLARSAVPASAAARRRRAVLSFLAQQLGQQNANLKPRPTPESLKMPQFSLLLYPDSGQFGQQWARP